MFANETNKNIIEKFINNIPQFRNKLKSYKKYDNKDAIRKINDAIKLVN